MRATRRRRHGLRARVEEWGETGEEGKLGAFIGEGETKGEEEEERRKKREKREEAATRSAARCSRVRATATWPTTAERDGRDGNARRWGSRRRDRDGEPRTGSA